jgi:ketosteroid isomerase-like protein
MRRCLVVLLSLLFYAKLTAQPISPADEQAIRTIINQQQKDWNKGDIAAFMTGYWKNDSLTFTGASGITYGWTNTYQNYLKRYDSPAKMGQLAFTVLEILPLGQDHMKVIGRWHLTRSMGNIGGHFTLIFKRFADGWKIISDHTS